MTSPANGQVRNETYGIRGIPLPPDVKSNTKTIPFAPGIPVRRSLPDLAAAKDPTLRRQWTLFVLALERFKSEPVDRKLSYYQIAGIHGYPQVPWDDPEAKEPFYCTHNSMTFPTWHRVYLLLYEQRLWEHMKEIIASWELPHSEAYTWNHAADTWRLPYWDWAQKQAYNDSFSLPEVATQKKVKIYLYKTSEEVAENPGFDYENPLWGFENPEKGPDGKPRKMGDMPPGKEQWNIKDGKTGCNDEPLPWSQCSGVSRHGIIKEADGTCRGLEGVNNFKAANEWINRFSTNISNPYPCRHEEHGKWRAPGSLADAVNRMFSTDYTQTWATFSSTKWFSESESKPGAEYMSLEYIHNNIHNLAGGSKFQTGVGHLSDVPVAAFDPLFWLHHCNIDRLFAMWQVLHWDAWWTTPHPAPRPSGDPTPDDPLKPFHTKDKGDPYRDYWTSTMTRDWTRCNYQYDDLVPNPGSINPDGTLNEEQYRADVLDHIQDIYPSTKRYIQAIRLDDKTKYEDIFDPDTDIFEDYTLNVLYDRYALEGRSYTIEFILEGRDIGQVSAFAGLPPESGGCPNCASQKEKKVLSRGQVPLTLTLLFLALEASYRRLNSLKRNEVADFLTSRLRWRFVQLGGNQKPAEDFPKTKISIWHGTEKIKDLGHQSAELHRIKSKI
ncbi:common central domain of tyrosinase-domain-containing protein [Poronia punctata]|nr:common central domain of tyrosinase-domain-containing protein [Poronia punctata]